MKNCGVLVPRQVSTGTQLSAAAGRTALSRSTPKPTDVTKVLQVGGKPRSSREGQGPRTIGRELGGGGEGGGAPQWTKRTLSPLPGATGS